MANQPECFEFVNHLKIVVQENGKRLCVNNPSRRNFLRAKIDRCAVVNTAAADFVLSLKAVGHLIVELKGRDVEHACSQVIATAESHLHLCRERNCGHDCKNACGQNCAIAGIIVASRYPKHTSVVARRQEEFAKKFCAPLRVKTQNAEITFEEAVSF